MLTGELFQHKVKECFMRDMKLIKAKWITLDKLQNIGQCREDAPLRSSVHLLIN